MRCADWLLVRRTGIEEVGLGLPLAAEAGSGAKAAGAGAGLGGALGAAGPELLAGPALEAGLGGAAAGSAPGWLSGLASNPMSYMAGASLLNGALGPGAQQPGAQMPSQMFTEPQKAGGPNPGAIRASLANAQSRGLYSGAASSDSLANLVGMDPMEFEQFMSSQREGGTA